MHLFLKDTKSSVYDARFFCCYNQHIKQNNRIVINTDWQTDRQTDRQSYRRTYLEEQKRPHKETKEESLPCGQTDKCNKAHTIACWDQELHDAPSLAMCSIILYASAGTIGRNAQRLALRCGVVFKCLEFLIADTFNLQDTCI